MRTCSEFRKLIVNHKITPLWFVASVRSRLILRTPNQVVGLMLLVSLLTGCTSVSIQQVARSEKLSHICIEEKQRVIDDNFLAIVADGFTRHGISSEIFTGTAPARCMFVLSYTAWWSLSGTPFLSFAEFELKKQDVVIGYAKYRLKQDGGLSPTRWHTVKEKLAPVFDRLLEAYP